MPKAISSILLAGGKSSRMGKDKARLKLDGRLMILQGIARKLLTISDIDRNAYSALTINGYPIRIPRR